ncbi:hypothetical protein Vretimale_15747 [Volvox reticuliferus]|nr:hypothetical protein Vretimale_15747 [Volvox reticuliferus]
MRSYRSLKAVSGKRAFRSVHDTVELHCPEVIDPSDGVWKPDPNCTVPLTRIARGDEVTAFQRKYNVISGDKVAATFDIPSRRTSGNKTNNDVRSLLAARGNLATDAIFRSDSIRVLAHNNEQKEIYTGSPIELRGVVYLLDFCGWKSPFRTAQALRTYLFSENGSVEGNIQNYYRTCSFGKTVWDPKYVAVVGPLQLDCKGTVANGALQYNFDASRLCGANELMYWRIGADTQAQKLAASDPSLSSILQWSQRRRIMMILPPEIKCNFNGIADATCAGSMCRSFINTKSPLDVNVLFHELQHNHGLNHAGRNKLEYGDLTDPMGDSPASGQKVHCHNAAYNWRIGWARPITGGVLTAANFTPTANRIALTIPASGTTDMNMVILDMGSSSPQAASPSIPYPKYFLSFRVRNTTFGGYDGGLSAAINQAVVIHNYNGTASDRDALTSNLVAIGGPRFDSFDPAFPAGNVWTGPFTPFNSTTGLGGGLRVKVVSVGPSSAVVELCRMYSQTEGKPGSAECQANLDRDCDGKMASLDSDCNPK